MNAPNHPRSAIAPNAVSPAVSRGPLAFTWRYDLCPSCDTATGSRGCEECEGSGEVAAACAGCFNVYPLNDDGECSSCAALVEVEHLGPGRIAA